MQIVLLSGGSGKRLWPLSNNARSKQFLPLLEKENGETVRYVIDGSSDEATILKVLAFYGISDNRVSLWGTGTP